MLKNQQLNGHLTAHLYNIVLKAINIKVEEEAQKEKRSEPIELPLPQRNERRSEPTELPYGPEGQPVRSWSWVYIWWSWFWFGSGVPVRTPLNWTYSVSTDLRSPLVPAAPPTDLSKNQQKSTKSTRYMLQNSRTCFFWGCRTAGGRPPPVAQLGGDLKTGKDGND